ncbi:anaphase-promoting complex subunit 4 isoform X2 [Iris pallida]|uniref:Anaphase-promoting complex subunit 4 isoform X2 n=1 Tax=Iris pallida TaxID=29817 RepID=A0AAX6GGA8_IRIPA|nr:anaphase-promoting complex subunit 4 isoform X2 [Iris pallida]
MVLNSIQRSQLGFSPLGSFLCFLTFSTFLETVERGDDYYIILAICCLCVAQCSGVREIVLYNMVYCVQYALHLHFQ